jgi:hypothetical protein
LNPKTGDVIQPKTWRNLQRHSFRPEKVGLTLTEAKHLLGSVQRVMVQEQLSEYITEQTHCRECGQTLARKGQHEIVFRTLFGGLRLCSPRLYRCSCQHMGRASFSPLAEQLPERTAPELVYLETKFAALLSYGLTVDILNEILPIGGPLNVYKASKRIEIFAYDLEAWEEHDEAVAKLPRAVQEFGRYIEVNQHAIPNYGDRCRHGEMINIVH